MTLILFSENNLFFLALQMLEDYVHTFLMFVNQDMKTQWMIISYITRWVYRTLKLYQMNIIPVVNNPYVNGVPFGEQNLS